MYRLFLVLFLAVSGHVGHGHCRSLVSLQLDSGEWLLVKEIGRGLEYWLYPRPEIQAASWCSSCAWANVVQLSVRFWSQELLESAQGALRRQGWCSEEQRCQVAPFQAARVVLSHPSGRWKPLRRSIALSGVLPDVVDFAVRPVSNESFNNAAAVPLEQLTALEISIQLAEDFTRADASSNKPLVITNADLKMAFGLLRAKQNKVIDQRSLQKLVDVLLKMKMRHLDGATALRPALRAKLQQQLTTSSVEFHDDLKALLPRGYRAKPGDVLFIVKQLEKSEQISISIDNIDNSKSVTVGVRLHRALTTPDTTQLNNKLPAPTDNDGNISLLRQQVEKLALLTRGEHILNLAVMHLHAIDDCFDIQQKKLKGGVFYLRPLRRAVWCTEDGYLVILNRFKDTTNFNLTFKKYEDGIGDVKSKGYFIGLRALSQVTLEDDSCMVVKLYPWRLNVRSRTAAYDSFTVSDSSENYRLNYTTYKGTTLIDVLSYSKGQMFTTVDKDNDPYVGNCAKRYSSGNWYASCQRSNLFGPYRSDAFNGMCSTGIAKSQGTMCSPLNGVQMLLRKKIHTRKSTQIVYSVIASPRKNCTSTLEFFNVTEPGLYTITAGGGTGGRSPTTSGTRPGGRGAKLSGVFHLKGGSILVLSAGCRGQSDTYSGNGGSASWAVLRPQGVLLAVAGGGGGASHSNNPENHKGFTPLAGLHGRTTPGGGDMWWPPDYSETFSASSVFNPDDTYGRGKGWRNLRSKFLTASSGDTVDSGGINGNWKCGGGGGGFEGGYSCNPNMYASGGGGGSLCNATEAKSCSVEAGGNTRPDGFVIVERHFCF